MVLMAREYYDPRLPFHNWWHAEEVTRDTLNLVDQSDNPEMFDRELLRVAAAWHDAGHNHDERHKYPSAEEYSIYLMKQSLAGQLTDDQLRRAEIAILGTRMNEPREDIHAIALHYGDIGNMSHDRKSFVDHTVRLWRESGCPPWNTWRASAVSVIGMVATQAEVELPNIGVDPADFYEAITDNIRCLEGSKSPTCAVGL